AGKVKELGPACDIYSLGAVLYELLTGHLVFQAESPFDTIKQVLEDEPLPPRHLNSRIDHDLETICLKGLQKDPKARYLTAEALAEDLNRFPNHEPISARSFSMIDRLARTLDRTQHAGEFHSWSKMLMIFAALMFVGHLMMFFLMTVTQAH